MTRLRIPAERPSAHGYADSQLVRTATEKLARGDALTVLEYTTLVAANAWALDQLAAPPRPDQVFPHAVDRGLGAVLLGEAGSHFVRGDLSLPVASASASAPVPVATTDPAATAPTRGAWRRSGSLAPRA